MPEIQTKHEHLIGVTPDYCYPSYVWNWFRKKGFDCDNLIASNQAIDGEGRKE